MKLQIRHLEQGQVVPILVIGILVTVMMGALLIDGSALMVNRRTAQAAADAGALAGAQEICAGASDPVNVAITYATVYNDATSASATVSGKEITVVATVEHAYFFSGIFGQDSLTASAEAVAGCFPVSISKNPLPIAFYFNTPPVTAQGVDCTEDGTCGLVVWDIKELLSELQNTNVAGLPLDYLYIVADSTRICQQNITGDVICSEMSKDNAGGSRSWIDLSPLKTSGAQNLASLISDGINKPLYVDPKIWVNTLDGSKTSGYRAVFDMPPIKGYESLPARLTYVPLFDKFCPSNPATNCADPTDTYIDGFKPMSRSYRLEGYAAFLVTCVTVNRRCEDGTCIPSSDPRNPTNRDQCPGYITADPTTSYTDDAIEGYFVDGFDPDLFGIGGADAGLYIITLIQ